MTARLHPLRRTIVGALPGRARARPVGDLSRIGRGHRADGTPPPSTTPCRRREPCACWSRCPATRRSTSTGVEVTMDGKDVEAEAVAASQSSRAAHLDPGDRHQRQHARHPHRRGQEGCPRLPLGRARQRAGRRPDLRRHGQPGGAAEPRPRRRPAARSPTCSSRSSTSLYDGVLGALEAAGPGGAKAGQRKILVLSDGKDTTDHGAGRRGGGDQDAPRPRSTSSPCRAGTRRTRH